MDYAQYAFILVKLAEKDKTVREQLLREHELSGGYHPEMENIHRENAGVLKKSSTG